MRKDVPADNLQWNACSFAELDKLDLYHILQLRSEVFVVEQQCPFQDMDGMDMQAIHLLGSLEGTLLCYARILPPGLKYDEASIGRVISKGTVRGTGRGLYLMEKAIICCRQLYPSAAVRISAQQRLERFYLGFGFTTVSEPYMEDDLPHVEMLLG
jgi:ElaA protein